MSDNELQPLHESSKLIAAETEKRNALIVSARIAGWPWPTIAEAAGLSLSGVQKIARLANGGTLPVPRTQVKPKFN